MDICRWGLGKTGLPKIVYSSGGKFIYDNDQETPNTQQAIFDYGDSQIVFEVRGLVTGSETGIGEDEGNHIGNIFLGSDGYLALDVNGFTIWRGEKREPGERMKYQEPVEWEPRRTSPNSWPPCAAASTPT